MSSGPACPPRASCAGRTALRLRHRPQDVRPPACSASSPASGAMGCGNSTATNAGAGRGESDGRPGARGRRRGESGEVCRAGRLGERGEGRGGGKEGCRDPGREGVQPPLLVRISRTGAVRPLLKRPKAGHFPPERGRSRLDQESLQGDPAEGAREVWRRVSPGWASSWGRVVPSCGPRLWPRLPH